MGSKPKEPDEGALYSANCVQWQASPGACEKCSELDGKYFDSESDAPEKPHPNCKCQLVECFYGSEYTEWKEYKRMPSSYEYPDPVVFPFSLNSIPILWTRITVVRKQRTRTTFKLCGERKEILGTKLEEKTDKLVEHKYSTAYREMESSDYLSSNPWVWGDTRRGRVLPTH